MRIERISVSRFGPLHDLDLRLRLPTTGGLVVVEGPNEAGKSTLLRFVQSVLFGGESVEGALVLEQEGQRFRVQQRGGRGTLAITDLGTGAPADLAVLHRLLGNLDAKVYRNVFAFGLSELQALGTLTDEGIQERIFSAAVAGAGRSVRSVQSELQKRMLTLFRPRSNSQIRDTARELKEALGRIRDAERALGEYESLRGEEERLSVEINELAERQEGLRGTLRARDILLEVHERWHRRLEAQAALAEAPVVEGLPSDALDRLHSLRTQTQMLAERVADHSSRIERLRGAATAAVAGENLLPLGGRLAALTADLAVQRQRLKEDLPKHRDALEQAERLLAAARATLGEDWTEELLSGLRPADVPSGTLEAFAEEFAARKDARVVAESRRQTRAGNVQEAQDKSDALRVQRALAVEQWLEAGEEIRTLHEDAAVHRSRVERLTRVREEMARARAEIKNVCGRLGVAWGDGQIAAFNSEAEWRRAAEEARAAAAGAATHRHTVQAAIEAAEAQVALLRQQLEALGDRPARSSADVTQEVQDVQDHMAVLERIAGTLQEYQNSRNELHMAEMALRNAHAATRSLRVWAAVAAAIVLPLGIAAWVHHSAPAAAIGLVVMAAALTALLWPSQPPADVGGLDQARAAAESANRRMRALERRVYEEGIRAGLPDTDLGAIHEALRRSADRVDALEAEKAACEHWEVAERALNGARDHVQEQQDRLAEAQRQEETPGQAWREWCVAHQVPAHVQPVDMPGFLTELEHLAGLVRLERERQAEADALGAAVQDWRERTGRLAARLETGGPAGRPDGAISALSAGLDHANRLQAAIQTLAAAQAQLAEAEGQLMNEQAAGEDLVQRWTAWCAEQGIPALPTPEDARRWLSAARTATERLEQARTQRAQTLGVEQRALGWTEAACALLADAGAPLPTGAEDVLAAVEAVAAAYQQAVTQAGNRDAARTALREAEEELAERQAELSDTNERVAALLRECGAATEADIPERVAWQAQRAEWRRTIADAQDELGRRTGKEAMEYAALLDRDEPVLWEAERDALTEQLGTLDARLNDREDGLRTRLGEVRARRATLEASADIPTNRLRAEELKTALTQQIRRWILFRLAEDLIGDTLKEYERTHVPNVLRSASARFAAVTTDRYRNVQAGDKGHLRVHTADDDVLDAGVLSRGTQEQLYFVVRLGLADSFAEQSASLPLVLDDVLVNADPERRAGVVRVLAEASRDHQSIVLTCHPDTSAALLANIPDAQVVRLPRISASDPLDVVHGEAAAAQDPGEVAELVARCLREHADGLTAAQIGTLLGVEQGLLRRAIGTLEDAGALLRDGRNRGATYRLSDTETA